MECPQILVGAHARMLAPLQAEESMRAAEQAAVGSGSLKPAAARDIMRGWQRRATSEARPAPRAARSPEMLATFGIKFEPPRASDAASPATSGN